jgi:hypothetical protein
MQTEEQRSLSPESAGQSVGRGLGLLLPLGHAAGRRHRVGQVRAELRRVDQVLAVLLHKEEQAGRHQQGGDNAAAQDLAGGRLGGWALLSVG